jgi:O-antigen/teichoic acid export membrane protein
MTARLSRHTFILIISNLGGAALSFALTVIIGRSLGESGLGQYAVVMAWVFPLSLLVEGGLGTLATRDLARSETQTGSYLRAITLGRLWLGLPILAGLILTAPFLSRDAAIVTGLYISAPLVLILPFFGMFTAVFRARGAMYPIPWLNIGMLVAQVALTAWVFSSGGSIIEAFIVNVATSAGQLVGAWAVYRWRFFVQAHHADIPALALLRRALPFALAAFFVTLQMRLGVLMLEQIAGTAEAGQFSAANRIIEAGRMLPNAFFGALLPALSGLAENPSVLRQTMRRAMWLLAGFGLAAAVPLLVLAQWIIALIYGDAFLPAVPVLQIHAGVLLLGVLRGGQTLYCYATGREQRVNLVNGLAVIAYLLLSLWLIPPMGAVGAALALLLVEGGTLLILRQFSG